MNLKDTWEFYLSFFFACLAGHVKAIAAKCRLQYFFKPLLFDRNRPVQLQKGHLQSALWQK